MKVIVCFLDGDTIELEAATPNQAKSMAKNILANGFDVPTPGRPGGTTMYGPYGIRSVEICDPRQSEGGAQPQ